MGRKFRSEQKDAAHLGGEVRLEVGVLIERIRRLVCRGNVARNSAFYHSINSLENFTRQEGPILLVPHEFHALLPDHADLISTNDRVSRNPELFRIDLLRAENPVPKILLSRSSHYDYMS